MKKYLLPVLALLMVLSLTGYILMQRLSAGESPAPAPAEESPLPAADTLPPEPSAEPLPADTPEPTPELFTISYIGDLTLTNHQHSSDFAAKMNGDYAYPFSNVADYFRDDEYTIGNLECTFSDRNLYSEQTFFFRAPTEYANILLEGGVDFVTTANNHTEDFYEAGKQDTWQTLEDYRIPFGKNEEAKIVLTPHGLRLGIYCVFDPSWCLNPDKAAKAIEQLKADGADYIIIAVHWGIELHVRPEQFQIDAAHACIDAGADMIYGSHPHCLQPIEEYNGGLILYSMGNFCFGGHTAPSDPDTAIVQVTMMRDLDGTVKHVGYKLIPCCVSSRPVLEDYWGDGYNDYRPTPYEEGTEAYERALSKIDGSYEGENGEASYGRWHEEHG